MLKKTIKAIVMLTIIVIISFISGYIYVSSKVIDKGITTTPNINYVGIETKNVAMKDYTKVITESFEKIGNLIKENPNAKFGYSFTSYKKSNNDIEDSYDIIAAVEIIDGMVEVTDTEFMFDNRESIKANEFEYKGSYSLLPAVWFYIISKTSNQFDENFASYEIYKVTKFDNVEPKEYVTEIFIPVK